MINNCDLNIKQKLRENSIIEFLNTFKADYLNSWWDTELSFPKLDKKYSKADQLQKEKSTNKFIKKITKEIEAMSKLEDEGRSWSKNIKSLLREFGKNILEFADEQLDILFMDGFTKSTVDFLKEVKKFDSEIKVEDTFQAIRNVWIMNSIQLFLNEDVGFSPSLFAYSMLYPYTDNYLDDDTISKETKIAFNHRFKGRLAGEYIKPLNSHELAIFMLVDMIENQYPRENFPQVYEALLAIQNAQSRSLVQQDKVSTVYEKNILGITFEKGGMSVLADACLVKGRVSEKEADFMFGFGVILQLADDLQDIKLDKQKGHMTIFSQIACTSWKLDNVTNMLFNFINKVLCEVAFFNTPKLLELKNLIRYNCTFLLFQSIAKNKELYSKEFIKKIEVYSPYSFKYLKSFYDRLQREQKKLKRGNVNFDYMKILDEL
jgi:hypothetical protein